MTRSGQFSLVTLCWLRTPGNQVSSLVNLQKSLVLGEGLTFLPPAQLLSTQVPSVDAEFREPVFEQKRAQHLSWGAIAAGAFWGRLWGLITVGEKSQRRKQHTGPRDSHSEPRTVTLMWLPSAHWDDGAPGTGPSSGWGLRGKRNLSTPGHEMR